MRGERGSPCYIGNLFGRLQKKLSTRPAKKLLSHIMAEREGHRKALDKKMPFNSLHNLLL